MLRPEDDELVIVSDGELCLTPWAAVIEWIRVRIVPSPTSYQLILSVLESHHRETGAQKEVESIALILNTIPLMGRQATKAEVMKWMSSVGVIHIAAHADENT